MFELCIWISEGKIDVSTMVKIRVYCGKKGLLGKIPFYLGKRSGFPRVVRPGHKPQGWGIKRLRVSTL